MEFVDQTRRMFQEFVNGGHEIASSSLNSQVCHQNGLISSEESCFLDAPPDFGIPNEFFQMEDFNLGSFTPKDDFLSFIPVNYDESVTISGSDVDPLGNMGDLGDILAPVIDGSHSSFDSYSSGCMFVPKPTRQFDCSALGQKPKERLFAGLGIEELLEGISGISNAASTSCVEGQVAKRRKTGNSMWEASSLQPVLYNNNLEPKKDAMAKSASGLRMVDGYSMSGSSTIVQAMKQVETSKPAKKKAKPGTRPRPKDRQQILDRMAELRQLIPNGEKMSIDCLLDRTIKHMLFLQSVTKQAVRIKEADEPKHNGVVSIDPSTNGVTWACELGNQTVVCPLIVGDLGSPGQMLVEINRHVTRHWLFSALVRLLQMIEVGGDGKKYGEIGNSLLDDLNRQSGIQNLVNLAEMQYCMNL
ncbi:Myc-type, basic helix-loop-helix (bHLH) domain-containing protein [Cynara cardunculus var. scolymus]|uniref:Myc-type, basic helix-loop-helix (BHLH) domain-containing protein n=1 Tax=Cynara cardunculus var. scolymus TaxID=59895 RepID=A0A118JUZ9_CYNCS|nr:Myc-type, basic helix-loop-helix (bHLH) domain-containing protein [Cynara cardunculus var. scolymus]